MAEGRVLTEGKAEEVMANEQVIEAYLGTGLKNKTPAEQAAAQSSEGASA
jgi:branched-chain amino acid transport system ATP-binding protein